MLLGHRWGPRAAAGGKDGPCLNAQLEDEGEQRKVNQVYLIHCKTFANATVYPKHTIIFKKHKIK
jgi:hypothetical protein